MIDKQKRTFDFEVVQFYWHGELIVGILLGDITDGYLIDCGPSGMFGMLKTRVIKVGQL